MENEYVLTENGKKIELTYEEMIGISQIWEDVRTELKRIKPKVWGKYLPTKFQLAQMLIFAKEFDPTLDYDYRCRYNLPNKFCRYVDFYAGWARSIAKARNSGLGFNFNYFVRIEIYPDGSYFVDSYTSTRSEGYDKGAEMSVLPDFKLPELSQLML